STLGSYRWLKAKDHQVNVVLVFDFASCLDGVPGREDVIVYLNDITLAAGLIQQTDNILVLANSALTATNTVALIVQAETSQKWMIDHHLDPEDLASLRYWDATAAATAQLVYTFISDVNQDEHAITAEIATCLYAGIMTEPGSFRFRSTTAEVHLIISKLIEAGARNWEIHEHVYNSSTENRLKF